MAFWLVLTLLLHGPMLFSDFLKTLELTPSGARHAMVTQFLRGRSTPLIEEDSLLTFVWFGEADSVAVNGTSQDFWRSPVKMNKITCGGGPHASGLFYRSYVVPPDARFEYKLIVNGEYRIDATNRRVTPPGDFLNSEAVMPQFRMSPASKFRPDIPHGSIDSLEFTSNDTSIQRRTVWIYRPPGYAVMNNLPVVYVHDGATAMRFALIPTIVDNLIADRELPAIMCVFVPPVERSAEYLGAKTPAFIRAFCNELVPRVDKAYHTSPDPSHRGVMGISAGGNIALTLAIVRPDCFHLAAGQSSAIGQALRAALADSQQAPSLPRTMKVWLDWGTYDIVDREYDIPAENRRFSAELSRLGIPHQFREVHDGHDWASWRERTPEILRYFFTPLTVDRSTTIHQR
jgi:enterochelin esterase-like enzyme